MQSAVARGIFVQVDEAGPSVVADGVPGIAVGVAVDTLAEFLEGMVLGVEATVPPRTTVHIPIAFGGVAALVDGKIELPMVEVDALVNDVFQMLDQASGVLERTVFRAAVPRGPPGD